jgi:hypothetical protein
MRFLPVSCLNPNRLILLATTSLVLALGCTQSMQVDTVVTAKSCTDNAHTMTFEMQSNSPITGTIFLGGTPNVLGIAAVYANGTSQNMTVVSELDNAMKNDKVEEAFHAYVSITGPVDVSLANLAFYQADWQSIGAPDCAVVQSPEYTITYSPAPGLLALAASPASLSLAVSDPYPLPMTLVALDLVASPAVLDASLLDWDNASFNALPWASAAPGGAILDAASPPLAVNLPDTATGAAVLCRCISIYDGMEVRGIIQISLSPPLATRLATWGAVKALYR